MKVIVITLIIFRVKRRWSLKTSFETIFHPMILIASRFFISPTRSFITSPPCGQPKTRRSKYGPTCVVIRRTTPLPLRQLVLHLLQTSLFHLLHIKWHHLRTPPRKCSKQTVVESWSNCSYRCNRWTPI